MPDARQTAVPETETTVVCRLAGASRRGALTVIFIVPIGGMIGFAALFAATGQGWVSLAAALLLTGIGWPLCVWGLVYLRKAHIIANGEGLQWCMGGKTRRTPWVGVSDYFDHWEQNRNNATQTRQTIVKTAAGKLVLSPGSWTHEAELRDCIAQHATQCAPQWRTLGGPVFNLPLRCHYATTVNRNILGWMDSLHWYGLLAVVVYFALQWFTTHTLPGWGWLLTPTGLFVIAKQTLPFLLRPTYRATQPRLDDKVHADKDGLRFVTGGSEAAIAWADIADLYSLGIRSVVVTRDGSEYDFLDTLTNVESLKLVIPRLAVNAGYRGWRTGTVRRQEIAVQDGRQSVECVYRYRSQNNCASLVGLTLAALLVSAVAGGPALIAWQSGAVPGTRELSLAAGGLLSLAAMVWLWGNYWRGAIRTNDDGITQQTLLDRRFMAWGQIRTFRWRGGADLTWGYVEGMGGTIKFWKGLGDAERLADEIAAHLDETY